MPMEVEDQNKVAAFFSPLLVFITCFIAVVFSINQIIDMAKPKANADEVKNEQLYYAPVNTLMQSSSPINYKQYNATVSASFSNQPTLQAKFNIDPQVEKLPPNEQNDLIRLKIMELKIDQLQNQISHISSTQSESLIFKSWFWFYSLIIWAGSIVGGEILTFHTKKLIYKCWGNS